MAYESPGYKITLVAAESMVAAQFKFAKISADNTASIGNNLTDIPCGVIQNNVVSGGATEIMVSGISKIKVGAAGAVVAGNSIGCDAAGCAKVVGAGGAIAGQVILGAGANEICSALINCAAPAIKSV